MGRFRNIRHKYKWLDYTVEIDRTMVSLEARTMSPETVVDLVFLS
jgi:hypothetical protein